MSRQILADLGFRWVDADCPDVAIIHRSQRRTQRRWPKRRQAIETAIGHRQQDHCLDYCRWQGALGDAPRTILRAAGDSLRWLNRAIHQARSGPGVRHWRAFWAHSIQGGLRTRRSCKRGIKALSALTEKE